MFRLLFCVFLFCFVGKTFAQINPVVIISDSEKDLVPEGITVDSKTGSIYISSIAKQKIIVINKNGKHKDFVSTNKHKFLEGLGMKVDVDRNLLWAISVKTAPKQYVSQVHGFNLKSGKQEQFYSLADTTPHMFNDLDIDEKGNLYVTDTYFSGIYFIDTHRKTLELFLKTPEVEYPNGIAIGNNLLYLATYKNGPIKVDLATKKASLLSKSIDSVIARGLDGLVYTNNSLIGVYNYSFKTNSFDTSLLVKYTLSADGDKIIKEEIYDKGNPNFIQPTTLALANRKIYVLANTHLGVYNDNKQSTKGKEAELSPVQVIKYDLSK